MYSVHHNYIRVFVFSILVCAISGTSKPDLKACAPGWDQYKQTCYRLLDDGMHWETASYKCGQLKSRLVTVTDEGTKRFLVENIMKERSLKEIWIGLNDHDVEREYVWENTSIPVTYTDWAEGQPENRRLHNETCVYLRDTPGNGWFDSGCSTHRAVICEKAAMDDGTAVQALSTEPTQLLNRILSAPAKTEICSQGFRPFRGSCYKVFDAKPSSRDYLVDVCVRRQNVEKSKRLVIDNIGMNNFVHRLLAQTMANEGPAWLELIGQFDEDGQFQFFWPESDGVLEFTNWNDGQPKIPGPNSTDIDDGRLCVKMVENGKWEIESCATWLKRIVCKEEMTSVTNDDSTARHKHSRSGEDCEEDACAMPAPTPAPSCPSEWIGIRNRCYRPFLESFLETSWYDANEACRKAANKGSLARMQTPRLTRRLRREIVNKLRIGNAKEMWIGLSDDDSTGEYHWVDGRPLMYQNWGSGFPQRGQDCVSWAFQSKNNEWYSRDCTEPMPFLCEAPRESAPNEAPEKFEVPMDVPPGPVTSPPTDVIIPKLKSIFQLIFYTNSSVTQVVEKTFWEKP